MFYNPNAIDNASAVLSTYCLLDTCVSVIGKLDTDAVVNAAVDGVVAPIGVLFIVLLFIVTERPSELTSPILISSILRIILF